LNLKKAAEIAVEDNLNENDVEIAMVDDVTNSDYCDISSAPHVIRHTTLDPNH